MILSAMNANLCYSGNHWCLEGLQGLANGLRTSAAYAAGKFAVGYGLPGRDCQEFQIDFLLEFGEFFAGYDSVAEGWHGV